MANFLEKLQSADEGTKTRWLIIITAVIMVVVIYVWLMYLNNLLATASTPMVASQNAQKEVGSAVNHQTSFNDRIGAVYHVFTDKIGAFGNILQTPREYIVKPN